MKLFGIACPRQASAKPLRGTAKGLNRERDSLPLFQGQLLRPALVSKSRFRRWLRFSDSSLAPEEIAFQQL